MKVFFARNKPLLFLIVVSLVSRLCCLPFVQNIEADSATRMQLSDELLHNFVVIKSGHWPSLHLYFNAFFIWLFHDRVTGPVVFSILLGALSVIPFYKLTERLFNREGAFYASLIFTFSALVFRLSFLALAEVFHLFFCLMFMYLLIEGINSGKKIKFGILAGLMATIACGGRFEAWMLAGCFFILLLFLKEWKLMLFFAIFTAPFPLFWLYGNYVEKGDALFSLHSVDEWNLVKEGVNEAVNKTELIRRILFFPLSLFVTLSPLVAFLLGWLIFSRARKKLFNRFQLFFLGLFVFFFALFIYKCLNGSLFTQHRFTITLLMLILPFTALWFDNENKKKLKKTAVVFSVVLAIPFSYLWSNLPYYHFLFFNDRVKQAVDLVALNSAPQTEAIPSLHSAGMVKMAEIVRMALQPEHGLMIDFINWERTFYLGLEARKPQSKTFLIGGAKNDDINDSQVRNFFTRLPKGILVLSDFSEFDNTWKVTGNFLSNKKNGIVLKVRQLIFYDHVRVLYYEQDNSQNLDTLIKNSTFVPPVFTRERDIGYWIYRIKMDAEWYRGVVNDARRGGISVKEQMKRAAIWMMEHEKDENKK